MPQTERLPYDCQSCGTRLPLRLTQGQAIQGDLCCPSCGETDLAPAPDPADQISDDEAFVIVAAYTNALDTQ